MASVTATQNRSQSLTILTGTVVTVVAVAALYWARILFVPLALAVFLSFILSTIIQFFERRGLGRVGSVALVLVLAIMLLSAIGYVAWSQVTYLTAELPKYSNNIRAKIRAAREASEASLPANIYALVKDIGEELTGDNATNGSKQPDSENNANQQESPQTVVVDRGPFSWISDPGALL